MDNAPHLYCHLICQVFNFNISRYISFNYYFLEHHYQQKMKFRSLALSFRVFHLRRNQQNVPNNFQVSMNCENFKICEAEL